VLDDEEVSGAEFFCDEPAATLVLRQAAEPPGSNCAAGGSAVSAGLDVDGDGALDDGEVLKTNYVCGEPPAAPPAILTRTAEELPGTVCPSGGTRVEAGPDVDGDGVLDDDEVRSTSVVCGPGYVSTRARTTLIEDCGGNGWIVESGIDGDHDGVLDEEEVRVTVRICDTVWPRFPVATAEDVAFLTGVTRIAGSLVVQGSMLEAINLTVPVVEGSVHVTQNPGLKSFGLRLGLLGGGISITGNPLLERAAFESISSPNLGALWVPRDVIVEDNPKLQTPLGSGELGRIGGSLRVSRNDVLQFGFSFEHLRFVGGDVVVEDNAALLHLPMSALEWVLGSFTIDGNPSLDDLRGGVPAVKHIEGRLVIRDNPAFTWAPFLYTETIGGVELSNNPALSLWLPAVEVVDGDVLMSGSAGRLDGPIRFIEGSVVVQDSDISALQLWFVERIGGDLRLIGNSQLQSPSLTQVRWVEGSVRIENNAAFDGSTQPFLDALERASGLSVIGNANLTKLALPSLFALNSLEVIDNPVLPTCYADALVAQLNSPPSVRISGNDDLGTCP
jgi:hypothetical protein